ncbi:MAG: 3-hydroxyacyl-CoA dehydrogenase/enoyl-CoA hydratase family protein [Deltaproteobacteria bacterium]|nr:3-hydroxyacyl-CoA dehydrogenase/enoyl-CoA hydratase family protein [Deltaproteobacteria bacterium]
MEVKNVVVLGAGAMGHGIALVAATAGLNVTLRDISEELVQKGYAGIKKTLESNVKRGKMDEAKKDAILALVNPVVDLKDALKDADFVIEAVPEVMKIKKVVLAEAETACPDKTIFASNTSGFSITEMSEALKKPERLVGLHFFNPVHVMQLVEIIYGAKTSDAAVKAAESFAKQTRKTAIYVRKDIPGFVVNRIFCQTVNEASWALYYQECKSPEEVDAAVKYRLGMPMGMLELIDTLGNGAIDIEIHVSNYFAETRGKSYGPPTNMLELFNAGFLGKKSGKGFYDWSEGKKNEVPLSAGRDFDPIRVIAVSINEAVKMLADKVTTKEDIDVGTILGLGFPRGILRIADDIGLDIVLNELTRIHEKYKEERYEPSSMLVDLVKEGKLGRKASEGFYRYKTGKDFELIKFSVNDKKIAKLTLDRPQRANALNVAFIDEIDEVLDIVEKDADIRCLIITGTGRNFCAGADMAGFASGIPGDMITFSNRGHEVFTRFETLSKPIIAAINGPAMGGGLEMALACDVRIMNNKTFVQLPETNLGLFPGWGGTQRLPRLIGMAKAKQFIYLGEKITADMALECGLANYVAEPKELDAFVDSIAEKLIKASPLGIKMAKKVMYYGAQADQRTGLFLEGAAAGDLCPSDDLSEGVTAFMNRRAAVYIGK